MKTRLLIFTALFLWLIFPGETSAVTITISGAPSSAIAGNEFSVSISGSSLTPSSIYYGKTLGGDNFYDTQTKNEATSAWLSWNAVWLDMPSFSSGSDGSASAILKSRFDNDVSAGEKQFKVRIRRTDSDTNYDSAIVLISVVTPTPTPSPSPTPTNSPTSSPTATPLASPKPSAQAGIASPKPTAKAGTPTPSVLGTVGSGQAVVDELREELKSPTPAAQIAGGQKKSFPILAIFFIASGLALIGFVTYSYLKGKKNDLREIQ